MPAGAHGTAGGTLDRDQVLDELELLTTVEHALVVEYLWVSCALGHDLPAGEGGAATTQAHDVAVEAGELAVVAMFRLKGLNLGLVEAGRSAQLGRAARISSDSVAEIAFGPPSPVQLDHLLEREEAIASAIEERYARLRPAVTSDPVFEGSLLDHLRAVIVEDGPNHTLALAELRGLLGDPAPADLARPTRREPADAFERRLLALSDRAYELVLSALTQQFAHKDFFVARDFRALAARAMQNLDETNRLLVQRGLLPSFTLP
jgi:hypothetical protein